MKRGNQSGSGALRLKLSVLVPVTTAMTAHPHTCRASAEELLTDVGCPEGLEGVADIGHQPGRDGWAGGHVCATSQELQGVLKVHDGDRGLEYSGGKA